MSRSRPRPEQYDEDWADWPADHSLGHVGQLTDEKPTRVAAKREIGFLNFEKPKPARRRKK